MTGCLSPFLVIALLALSSDDILPIAKPAHDIELRSADGDNSGAVTGGEFSVADALKRGVVITSIAGKKPAQCSGFIFSSGLVITAQHCKGSDMRVGGALAKILAEDEFNDLLILGVPTAEFPPLELRKDAYVAEEVIAVFTFNDWENVVSFGRVTWLGPDFIATDSKAAPGFSGSALYDKQGRLLGLNNRFVPTQHRKGSTIMFGMAVPAARISDLLKTLGAK
jgi:S1-C subfamily serine protease